MANKLNAITTPRGRAIWPHLTSPDTKFNTEGEYHTKLELEPSPETAEFRKQLDDMVEAEFEAAKAAHTGNKKFTFQPHYPYDELQSGGIEIKAKTKAQWPNGDRKDLPIFDAKGEPVTGKALRIGGGSVMRLRLQPAPFAMKATNLVGITLYLNAVQVISLVEAGASAEAMGFGEEDGGFSADDLEDRDESDDEFEDETDTDDEDGGDAPDLDEDF